MTTHPMSGLKDIKAGPRHGKTSAPERRGDGYTSRIFAGSIAWFGLGVILAESLNASALLGLRLNAVSAGGAISAIYLLSQILLRHLEKKAGLSEKNQKNYARISRLYRIALWVLGLSCMVSIPFLWWGVIKKLAVSAKEGLKGF